MKLSALEEYGLRCLLELARHEPSCSLSIPEISAIEGISIHNSAKLLRMLRQNGFVASERGQHGGYTLARPASEIVVGDVLAAMGGRLYEGSFCDQFSGSEDNCQHLSTDCAIRSLWRKVQWAVDEVVARTTLQDLLNAGQHTDPTASEPLLEISIS